MSPVVAKKPAKKRELTVEEHLKKGAAFHLVGRASAKRLLFRTHTEARKLFDLLRRAFPELVAVCVMPTHVHVMVRVEDGVARLTAVMSAYARWRNHRRGETGTVWRPLGRVDFIIDHVRRLIRYIHLNPCRRNLVRDPLDWPWSGHRDAVGLAFPPVCKVHPDVREHQRYVSSDESTSVVGTPLPAGVKGVVEWAQVRDAVSAVLRVPVDSLQKTGKPRTLAIRLAWHLGIRDADLLADATGLARSGVYRICAGVPARTARHGDKVLAACALVVGDPRFPALGLEDLASGWRAYRGFV